MNMMKKIVHDRQLYLMIATLFTQSRFRPGAQRNGIGFWDQYW
jgi:hypothetical protein